MKKNIVIELTPLLDVILILLFLVMTNVSKQVGAVQETAQQQAAAAAQREQSLAETAEIARQEQKRAEQALASFTLVDENCRIVTLSVEGAGESRLLSISTDGEADKTVPLFWGEEVYEENALNAALINAAVLKPGGSEQAVFLIFQYDRREIYQEDYELIHRGLLRNTGGNVYFAEYDLTK